MALILLPRFLGLLVVLFLGSCRRSRRGLLELGLPPLGEDSLLFEETFVHSVTQVEVLISLFLGKEVGEGSTPTKKSSEG